MSDIFISYAREDKERAELLSNAFSRQGWSVWWDREIPPGQSFDEMIENALHSARCVIVLWSKDSVLSRWVKTEAAEGAARGILIPVLMDKVQIPLEFKRIEAADLSDWHGTSSHFEFDQLLKTVAGVLSGSISTGVRRVPTTKMRFRRWWETRPSILAAMGGVIAVTMLIVVLYQTRVIDGVFGHIPETQNGTTTPTEATKHPALPRAAVPSANDQGTQYPRSLALRTEVRLNSALGDAVYKILAVQLDRHNVETLALRFTIRMTCLNGPSGCNFWDNSFRLAVNGVPTAPVSNLNTMLNKYVHPRSAEEGSVMFIIPTETQSTVLVVSNGSESTEIPVDLSAEVQPPTEATKHPALPRAAVPSANDQGSQYPRSLALRTEVRLNSALGDAVYKILAVQLDRHNVEKLALRFKIRATCLNGFSGCNFWDNSFRLAVNGVPTAPVSNLNKVVQARSAEEGEVMFVIPTETQSTVLVISNGSESTEIPVDLSANAASAAACSFPKC